MSETTHFLLVLGTDIQQEGCYGLDSCVLRIGAKHEKAVQKHILASLEGERLWQLSQVEPYRKREQHNPMTRSLLHGFSNISSQEPSCFQKQKFVFSFP